MSTVFNLPPSVIEFDIPAKWKEKGTLLLLSGLGARRGFIAWNQVSQVVAVYFHQQVLIKCFRLDGLCEFLLESCSQGNKICIKLGGRYSLNSLVVFFVFFFKFHIQDCLSFHFHHQLYKQIFWFCLPVVLQSEWFVFLYLVIYFLFVLFPHCIMFFELFFFCCFFYLSYITF